MKNLVYIFLVLSFALKAQVGFWTKVANNPPDLSGGLCLLLPDGTVMVKNETGGTGGIGKNWNRLTPDANGSYINGTWSNIAPMTDTRLYFSTQVLKDGRVYVAGGEYGTGKSTAEIYNYVTNTWTVLTAPGGVISDANSEILENGKIVQAMVNGSLKTTKIFDPSTNTYVNGPTSNGIHNESAWVKLQDNSFLFVDRLSTNTERYIPTTNTFVVDASAPVNLYDPFGDETGGAVLLPDGRAWFLGSPGTSAYYTPSGSIANGTWTAGPTVPGNNGATDAALDMMVNGKVLCAVSPTPTSGNVFKSPTYFYEFDYTTNLYSLVPAPAGNSYTNQPSYIFNFLNLPNGQVLLSRQDTNVYYIYTPSGSALAVGVPTVNSITQNGCNTFTMTGKLFNGISEGSSYGDDWQNNTNYPIVRLTLGSNVYYARTSNWNSYGVRRFSLTDTAQFSTPGTLPVGVYTLEVIANGIPSAPQTFIPIPFLSSSLTPPSVCSGSIFNYTPTSLVGTATFSWTRSAVAGISNAAVTVPQAGNPGETLINSTASPITVTYNYTTAANGCSYPQTVSVTVNPSPTLTITGTNTICAGNTTTLTVSGAPNYTWSTSSNATSISVSPATTTTYSVIGTNSFACSGTQSILVTINALPSISISGTSTLCLGNTTTLTASGANTYTWNTSSTNTTIVVNPTITTNYSVTGTDPNGCTGTQTNTVTVNPLPAISISGASTLCTGNTATLTANGAASYSWSTGSTNVAIVVSPTVNTTYSVTGTDSNGCTDMNSLSIVVSPCTGVNEVINGLNTVIVYPNPADEFATITFSVKSSGTYTLLMTDAVGRVIKEDKATANSGENSHLLSLTGISKGIYFIVLQKDNSVYKTKLLIK
jgi:hypothetical protein